MREKKNRGFTLIELLITAALSVIVGIVIYSTFAAGIKIWQRIKMEVPEEDQVVFADKLATDLGNSFKSTAVNFSGKQDGFEFATLVASPRLNVRTAGMVVYSYNDSSETINRSEKDYSHIYSGDEGNMRALLKNVRYLKCQYYKFDKAMKEYIWLDEWQKEDGVPSAVRVELGLIYGDKVAKFIKTVSIPAGG